MAKLTYFVCYNLSLSGMIKNVNSSLRELSILKKMNSLRGSFSNHVFIISQSLLFFNGQNKKKRRVRSTRQCSITSQSETSTEVGERSHYSLLLLLV